MGVICKDKREFFRGYPLRKHADECWKSHCRMLVFLWLEIYKDRLEWETSKRELSSYDHPFEGVKRQVTEDDQSIEFSTIIVKDDGSDVTDAEIDDAMKMLVKDARKAMAEWSKALDGFEEKRNLK